MILDLDIFVAGILTPMSHQIREFVGGRLFPLHFTSQYALGTFETRHSFISIISCKNLYIFDTPGQWMTLVVLRCECSTICTCTQTRKAHIFFYMGRTGLLRTHVIVNTCTREQ